MNKNIMKKTKPSINEVTNKIIKKIKSCDLSKID
jgi:hypothetical protein